MQPSRLCPHLLLFQNDYLTKHLFFSAEMEALASNSALR